MTKITIEMPNVSECTVTECAYNTEQKCHARAITVGDGSNPMCDTFFQSPTHTSATGIIAGVGACKVSICKFNEQFECQAQSIKVGHKQGDVECLTFSPS